jgi:hypothetical protein
MHASWLDGKDSDASEEEKDSYDGPLAHLELNDNKEPLESEDSDQPDTPLLGPDGKDLDDPEDIGPIPPLRSTRRPFRKVPPTINLVTDFIVNFNELFYKFEDPKCDDNCKEKMFQVFKKLGSGVKIPSGFEQIFVQKRSDGQWPKGWSPYRESSGMKDPEIGGYGERNGPVRRPLDEIETIEGADSRSTEKHTRSPIDMFHGKDSVPYQTHFEATTPKDSKKTDEEAREKLREKSAVSKRSDNRVDDDSDEENGIRSGKFFPRGNSN